MSKKLVYLHDLPRLVCLLHDGVTTVPFSVCDAVVMQQKMPLSASERQSVWVLSGGAAGKVGVSYLNIPLAAEPWSRCGPLL